jgi:acetyltransferase-like isoleucine patch superfamily enzyme
VPLPPPPRDLRELPWWARYQLGGRIASRGRLLLAQATHLHCRVEIQRPVNIGPGFRLDIWDGGTLIVGPGCDFRRGFTCEIAGDGKVVIGAGCVFTSNVLIQCSTSIEIGERCSFGQSVLIVDGQHRYSDPERHWLDQGYDFNPFEIGNGVGVSDKCTVQAAIGERAMIASQSVVNRPIPPYSVAAGVPARVIRRFGPAEAAGDDGAPAGEQASPRAK